MLAHWVARTRQDIDVTVLADGPSAKLLSAIGEQRIIPRFDDAAFIDQTRTRAADFHPARLTAAGFSSRRLEVQLRGQRRHNPREPCAGDGELEGGQLEVERVDGELF